MDGVTEISQVSIDPTLFQLYFAVTKILPCPVIVFGLVGNLLALAVMQRPNYSKSSVWVYLRYLAVCDTGSVIILGGERYVSQFVPLREYLGSFFCKQFYYGSFICSISTCVGITFMTIDRFVAVLWPLQAASWCTRKRAIITCVCISLVIVSVSSPQLSREMLADRTLRGRERCAMPVPGMEDVLYGVFTAFLVVSPTLVGILNTGIIVTIKRSQRQRSKMSGNRDELHESQVDVLLLIVSSCFCVCVWPFMIDWVIFYFVEQTTFQQLFLRGISYEIVLLLALCNSSINFYLYCGSSATIRKDLRELFGFNRQ